MGSEKVMGSTTIEHAISLQRMMDITVMGVTGETVVDGVPLKRRCVTVL